MRDFRDSKAMAQTLRAALAAKGHKISIAESLELIAKAFGAADWNTLAAAIKTTAASPDEPASIDKPVDNNQVLNSLAQLLGVDDWDRLRAVVQAARPPAPADGPQMPPSTGPAPRRSVGTSFSFALERSLHRAVGLATIRKHGFTTLEHLLLALIDDADAAETMRACGADLRQLSKRLTAYVDDDLQQLVTADGQAQDQAPTAGFHRVVQRAVIHVQSAGRDQVTGANVLVAIFSERESHAAYFLQQQGIERFDAVNFIAHGIRKDGGKAA